MNDEAESSRAPQHRVDRASTPVDHQDALDDVDIEESRRYDEQLVKERRLDAKRKRIRMLNDMLRELNSVVYMEIITLYYFDCSFFWLAIRTCIHGSLLTPISDPAGERPPDEPKPFLPFLLFNFIVSFVLHQTCSAPSAGEDTRGYLHGGLMIDFIGQQGPTSKWKLGLLDVGILVLQLVMVSVHVKRRELKKKLAKVSAGSAHTSNAEPTTSDATTDAPEGVATENATREQDADDEERGILHRTDTLSDIGLDAEEEDPLLAQSSDVGHADALDILTSGQFIIGEFSLIDTIIQENKNYSAYRLTRSESVGGMNDMPETLRRLNTLRARFGVGGG